ncbi:MAG: TRAP transporter substrate-binding protein DctP [Oscillospiraceae bacterium]|nr:TRAP transporter substrate-binding protein DctP [Oscillospiraceae bacterium]
MKKFLAMILALVMCLSLVACGGGSSSGGDSAEDFHIDIKFSNVFQPEEMNGQASEKLAAMITERTGGAVSVTYYGQNQLDCYGDSVAQAVAGANWMGLEEPSLFADYVGDCAVLIGPMLYASNEEYNYVMESDIVAEICDRLATEHNIHILDTHYSFGFRSVCTNKVVTKPEDLNGMVLRATSSALFAKTLECLGATPQAMGFTEAISAMSNGVVQGYEGSVSTHKDTGVYEFIHNVALTNHLIATRWLFISENVWQQIPEEYQTIIEECALECGLWEQQAVADSEAEMIAFLEEHGTTYNDVDLDAFTAACEPVYDWIVDEYGADPELRGKLVALVQEYREANA